ncbi:MAG: HD domain-containing protein [Endomicrobium sp.]|jgi:metal-dependent HD superfamily phosphatase/phosphodiesterase|nr:HD domain-containing protein [Endomicrobium sp.]
MFKITGIGNRNKSSNINIRLKDIEKNPIVVTFIKCANEYLGRIGYTEHGFRHVSLVASRAKNVLVYLEHSERFQNLAEIAGYMHDIGNIVNRQGHGQSAALIAMGLLKDMGMEYEDIAFIISAIGNHDEEDGDFGNPVAAALVLADKSDVHKTRVRNLDISKCDNIHDRVNSAVERSSLRVSKDKRIISLRININTHISNVAEYFEIFMSRMLMCKRAASILNCKFELLINDKKLV